MAIIPVKNLSTEDILYGDRNTQYRWEVLEHSNGVDYLVGTLDGVSDGSLSWVQNAAVKGSGKMEVIDLDQAAPGMLRIADLELETCRIRPVMTLNAQDTTGSYQEVWTEVRRNLLNNPRMRAAGNWGAAGGANAPTMTWTANGLQLDSPTTHSATFLTSMEQVPAAPGEWWSGGAWVTVPAGYPAVTIIAWHVWYNDAAQNGSAGRGNPITIQPGQTVYVSAARQAPASTTANVLMFSASLGTVPEGARMIFRDAMFEKNSETADSNTWSGATVSLVPYRRYSWAGVADASDSILEMRTLQWVDSGQPVLPEIPWGTFLLESAKEQWRDTGRVWSLSMLDRTTVPSQDVVDESFAVPAGTTILSQVAAILASSGEYVAVDSSVTLATQGNMVWETGTSKLKIINDLLDVAGYNSLWMDGWGNFQLTPRVLPADRSIKYELLDLPRELVDGPKSIYSSSWTRERDSFGVPNKVIAVQAAGGDDEEALVGQWTNTDPDSPYSYPSRGRWVPHVLDSVDVPDGTPAQIVAFLESRARATLVQMSAVQAEVKVEHLPIPVRVGDVLRFAHTKAGVDARHTITRLELEASSTGLMKSTLQEVISL